MKKNLKLTSAVLALSMLFSFGAVTTASAEETTEEVPAPQNSKTIKANEDGTYDVTVSFEGKVDTVTNTTVYASDVVLIADRSGSMAGTRWESLKNAVDVLTDKILPENSDNLVSVITFSSTTKTKIETFDDANDSFWTSSANEVSTVFENCDPSGTTYCAPAINAASTVLNDGRDNVKKYVIFLSDGDPFDRSASVTAAEELKSTHPDTTLYTVGIPDCNETFMKEVAGDESKYFFAEDADQLATVFDGIATEIKSGYKNVVLKDKISEFVEFANVDANGQPVIKLEVFDENGNLVQNTDKSVAYNEETGVMTLSLGEDMIPDQWRYTVTYTIKPNQHAVDTFWNGGYTSIGDANTDVEGSNTSSGKEGFYVGAGTLSFNYRNTDYDVNLPIPVVQVDETPLPTEPTEPTEATEATEATKATEATEATSATNPTSQPTSATNATNATSVATTATTASTTSAKAPATGSPANTVVLLAMLMISAAGIVTLKKHSTKVSK